MRIPFALEWTKGESSELSSQIVQNWYAEEAPSGEKTPVALYATPGRSLLGSTFNAAPIRGLQEMNGILFAVAGQKLYRVDAASVASEIGDVQGDGPVYIANNGTQMLIVTANNQSYIATSTTIALIADLDFPGAETVTFIDGYFAVNPPGTKRFFISSLNDGSTWDALDFESAEADPDNIVRVFGDHRELWLFGAHTIEVWYNSGDAVFPFERINGAFITRGCGAARSVVAMDNSIFWLGDDGIVYRANGYTPVRVSTHAIEILLDSFDVSQARAFSYTDRGHAFYVLTVPDKVTIVYDAATQMWHQRQTYGRNDWACIDYAFAYNKHITGSSRAGVITEIDKNVRTEEGGLIQRRAITVSIWAESQRATMSRFEVDFETGVGITDGQGEDPQAMLDWSSDGGKTWSNEKWVSLGRIGTYRTRAKWNRLGQFRQRQNRITVSDPVITSVFGAYADMVGGTI